MQLEQIVQQLNEHPDYKVLKRVPFTEDGYQPTFPISLNTPVGDEQIILIVDTETTGLSAEDDEMIELGFVKCLVSPSNGQVTSILSWASLLEQPKTPISEELTKVHGITNEMVAGLTFPDDQIIPYFQDVSLIVAHNANFDRGFFDKRFPALAAMPWACSIAEVDWSEFGFEGNKLLLLLFQAGYFYGAHRANIDCIATLRLFQDNPEAFKQLFTSASQKTIRIRAHHAPYSVKDDLKGRGYKWDGKRKSTAHWWTDVPESELEAETAWLVELVGQRAVNHFIFEEITSLTRYK